MVNTMQQLPTYNETFNPILQILKECPELRNKEITIEVRDKFYSNLPQELLLQKTSTGANTLLDRISWGISYLNMAGYVERPKRAYYRLTQKGSKRLENVEAISLEELKSQPEYIKHKNKQPIKKDSKSQQDKGYQEQTPIDLIDNGIEQIESEIKNQLLEKLSAINPFTFENIILTLLEAMGYGDTIGTNKSNDGGIDGVVNQDKLGLEQIYIQAKRFNENKVRETDIRNFIGAMSGDTNKGIFVTTSSFDEKAINKAKLAHHKIKLVDGQKLVQLMFQYGIGVQVKNTLLIKELDNDFFDE